MNGDAVERLIAEALGIPYVKGNSLDDIRDGPWAWSIKVRYVANPTSVEFVTLKLTTKFTEEKLINLTPTEIANIYLKIWSDLVEATKAKYSDLRTIILLTENTHRRFALYEYATHTWDADEFTWVWSTDKKTTVHGFSASGYKQFSIHLNDSRLFVHERIGDRHSCLLQPCESLDTAQIASLIGFTPQHVTMLPRTVTLSHGNLGEHHLPDQDILRESPKVVEMPSRRPRKPAYESKAYLDLLDDLCA